MLDKQLPEYSHSSNYAVISGGLNTFTSVPNAPLHSQYATISTGRKKRKLTLSTLIVINYNPAIRIGRQTKIHLP